MVKLDYDPLKILLKVINKMHPKINAVIKFVDPDDLKKEEETDCVGVTIFPDDGSDPEILIHGGIPYSAVLEIIAHEVAHVICGKDSEGHDGYWETEFNRIFDAYIDAIGNL